jgi:hypothetical protein
MPSGKNVQNMLRESISTEVLDLDGGWRENGKCRSGFCKIILEALRQAAHNVAPLMLCWDSSKGNVLRTTGEYCLHLLRRALRK